MTEESRFDAHKLVGDINASLRALITTVLEESDSRRFGILETLGQAVDKTSREIGELTEGDKSYPLTVQGIRNLLNRMQGRVLTVLDAVFESPVQREAVKSLARQKIWGFYNSVTSATQDVEKV